MPKRKNQKRKKGIWSSKDMAEITPQASIAKVKTEFETLKSEFQALETNGNFHDKLSVLKRAMELLYFSGNREEIPKNIVLEFEEMMSSVFADLPASRVSLFKDIVHRDNIEAKRDKAMLST
ncbi:MAG: hypothetical protein ETSY2_35040 [Candidatus Entotheonella gemina]|uniref:Uncharacterized protein n=1 Tax=Candidatus Entotheonella gemina TaxID=1429439 RepID=W4LX64_9BACT|nr:MAG: hypothetical protein ETSY2_35040 [Candidatus Entotheonella gemina]